MEYCELYDTVNYTIRCVCYITLNAARCRLFDQNRTAGLEPSGSPLEHSPWHFEQHTMLRGSPTLCIYSYAARSPRLRQQAQFTQRDEGRTPMCQRTSQCHDICSITAPAALGIFALLALTTFQWPSARPYLSLSLFASYGRAGNMHIGLIC